MRKPLFLLALLTVILNCGLHCIAESAEIIDPLGDPPSRGFVSRTQATFWEDALISGNGTLGAVIMGNPRSETIILSHERLFMPMDKAMPPVPLAPRLGEIRRLVDQGDYGDAALLAEKISTENGYKEMPWTDPLVPAFDVAVQMDASGETREYARSVDFETGVATVRWDDDCGTFLRRLFVSRADNVAVLSITGPKSGSINCSVTLTTRPQGEDEENEREDEDEGDEDAVSGEFPRGIKDVHIAAEGPWLAYRSSFARTYPGSLEGYEGATLVTAKGGSIETSGETVKITCADEVVLLARVEVLNEFEKSGLDKIHSDLSALEPQFDKLLERHVAIHGEIFNRTRLHLADDNPGLASEELIAGSSKGKLDPALLERLYDASRYAILSSTGDLPPTLQGIWTGSWTPAWMSDFTINGNVQTAIASMLSANMPEGMEAYFSLMEEFVPHFRENAQRMYGCRGILTPARISTHGYFNHFNHQYIHLFWTAGAGWASQFFYDYYLYTGDKDFLRKRALPFMLETARFYEDFLIEGSDGKYAFNPSYSPENTAGNSESQACVNATMDIAVCKELLRNLIAVCTELGVEEESVPRWKSMIEKLPDYQVNDDGAVKEWTTSKLEENYEHRHASHVYELYAGLPDEIAGDERLRRAFRRAIERRIEYYRERGGEMSFGLVQLGLAAASLGEAELAYETVDRLANDYWRPNLVSTHNPHQIFNVDICGGLPAVVNHMLVQSKVGELLLMPALPDAWPSGQIEGILCRGQIELKRLAWDGAEVNLSLQSKIEQRIQLDVAGGIQSIAIEDGQAMIEERPTASRGRFVTLPEGQRVTLKIVRGL